MKDRVVKTTKWDLRSNEQMHKISNSRIKLSFEQTLQIENHTFGNLELHNNGQTRSFGRIFADDIKCALYVTDLDKFKRGKITKQFFFIFKMFAKQICNSKIFVKRFSPPNRTFQYRCPQNQSMAQQ